MSVRFFFFFFSSRRRHTRFDCDWSSDVCSSDLSIPCTSCTLRVSPGKRYTVSSCNVMSSVSETTMNAPPGVPCAEAVITTEPRFTPVTAPVCALRSEEHTSELQSQSNLVCRLLLEKKKKKN